MCPTADLQSRMNGISVVGLVSHHRHARSYLYPRNRTRNSQDALRLQSSLLQFGQQLCKDITGTMLHAYTLWDIVFLPFSPHSTT